MKKEEKKMKRNNDRDRIRDNDISNQERLLVKDTDFKKLTIQMRSLSLLGSVDENNKFLESVISRIGSTPVIYSSSSLFENLNKSLSSALNPISPYISPNPPNVDDLVKNSNYYYANFFSSLTPASNIKYMKHDNLQDNTGRTEGEAEKSPRNQMQNFESAYLSTTYFPQAVSQLIPPHYTPPAAFETNSTGRNVSIRLHTDLQANKIANSYGADAVTVGKDIFFASGKYDISTPKGVALISHELEHVRQHQTNQDLTKAISCNSGNIPASLSFSLEKEALDTEKNVLMYFALYQDYIRRYQVPSSIMMSPTNISINSEMPTNYFYPIPKIGYSQSHPLNNAFHSSMGNLYSDSKFGQGYISDSSYVMHMRNGLPNLNPWSLPLESVGIFPDSVSSPIVADRNPEAFTRHQNITTDVSMQKHNLIHKMSAMTPLLADSGRSLPGQAPVHLSQLSPTSSSTSTNANTNMQPILTPGSSSRTDFTTDLDQLSDRVYQMIMEKIKIQREQRGFR